jgi:hypothetical protein
MKESTESLSALALLAQCAPGATCEEGKGWDVQERQDEWRLSILECLIVFEWWSALASFSASFRFTVRFPCHSGVGACNCLKGLGGGDCLSTGP